MATYTYTHAVKVDGEIIPPNTPVELSEPDKSEPATAKKSSKTVKKDKSE